jgi:hypothetical protein
MMGFGKHFLDENMLAQKLYHRVFGNLVIHTFGPVSWQRRSIFLTMDFFLIKDVSEVHFWEDKWLGVTTL